MQFRGLSSNFSRVSRLCVRSLLLAACVAVIFDLPAAAAGPNSKATLRVEITIIPSVQTTQSTTPVFLSAANVTSLDSTKEIKVEWRNLPQGSTSSAGQQDIGARQQVGEPKAVLETFTVVSP